MGCLAHVGKRGKEEGEKERTVFEGGAQYLAKR